MKTRLIQRLGNFCRVGNISDMRRLGSICLVAWMVCSLNLSYADENLGRLEFSDFLIEPMAMVKEAGAGKSGFALGNTKASVLWTHDNSLRGRLTLGPQTLIGRPAWAGIASASWGLVEAYGEAITSNGTIRLGLIPMGFGSEGWKDEARLVFPRSLLFENRVIGLRDYGVSYQISHNGFTTRLVVHNGEGSEDEDNRTLQTAAWGWRGGAGLHAGISATAGRFVATNQQENRLRIGNAFFEMDLYGVGFCAEGTLGESKTESQAQQFLDWHLDLQHSITPTVGILARFDTYDPDVFKGGDLQRQWIAGLSFKNEHETSRVFIYGMKRLEEPVEKINDEVRLVWRLNSNFGGPSTNWGN